MNKKKIISIILFLTVSFITYCFFPVLFFTQQESVGPGNVLIFDRKGENITDMPTKYGYYKFVPIDVNSRFIQALIYIEDEAYFSHYGIDVFSKLGAFQSNISAGRVVSGGSTLTEQYIKNKYFLGKKRSYLQKVREAMISSWFSLSYLPDITGWGKTKNEKKKYILEKYVQSIYLGHQNYGVGAAIDTYFGKHRLEDLSQEEITLL
ncbi:MAG: transglycosylase domain-containing protein, partial [Candidatus Gracilibacteria bacterium]|nr:transglycosylase domain-containing protein [Candidatus Gracilibacteria bacterium]